MIKVIHVIWNAKFGGIEKLVYDLCNHQLAEKTVYPEILLLQNEGEFIDKFRNLGIKIHELELKSGFDFNLKKLISAKKLFNQFDIVHLHSFNPLIALATLKTRANVIYTIHGGFGFGRKRRLNDIFLERLKAYYLFKIVDVITYNSQFTKKYSEKALKTYRHQNAVVVYNGISSVPSLSSIHKESDFLESLQEKIKDKFVIGTTSRFAGFKRIDRLIDAFSKLDKIENYRLLLVGEGVVKGDLLNQVKRLSIEEYVIFTGFKENITAYQNLMNICVFPSQNEPFGLVAVETLQLGKPTLVYADGGGITEIIERNNSLDIVRDDLELLERIYFYKKIGSSSESIIKRKKVAAEFDIYTMGENFYNIYNETLKLRS